jgi:hypothetical protein
MIRSERLPPPLPPPPLPRPPPPRHSPPPLPPGAGVAINVGAVQM